VLKYFSHSLHQKLVYSDEMAEVDVFHIEMIVPSRWMSITSCLPCYRFGKRKSKLQKLRLQVLASTK